MAFAAGLVTVTFRQLAPAEIVQLAQRAGVSTLEWGGDLHVPPGDLQRAADVRAMTRDAGLTVAASGSYFRVGDDDASQFQPVLQTALALGAPALRIWPGRRASAAVADAAGHSPYVGTGAQELGHVVRTQVFQTVGVDLQLLCEAAVSLADARRHERGGAVGFAGEHEGIARAWVNNGGVSRCPR